MAFQSFAVETSTLSPTEDQLKARVDPAARLEQLRQAGFDRLAKSEEELSPVSQMMFPVLTEGERMLWDRFFVSRCLLDEYAGRIDPEALAMLSQESTRINHADGQTFAHYEVWADPKSPIKERLLVGVGASGKSVCKMFQWSDNEHDVLTDEVTLADRARKLDALHRRLLMDYNVELWVCTTPVIALFAAFALTGSVPLFGLSLIASIGMFFFVLDDFDDDRAWSVALTYLGGSIIGTLGLGLAYMLL